MYGEGGFVRQHRFDGGPFITAEFVAHNSRLEFRSLNHLHIRTINPQQPVTEPLMFRNYFRASAESDEAIE